MIRAGRGGHGPPQQKRGVVRGRGRPAAARRTDAERLFYVGRDDPARHGSAFRSRHSEAKGRRIRLPRPWLPQGPHGRRNAFRRDPIFAKSASLLFTPSVRLRRTAPSSRGSCDGAPRSSRPTKEVVPWPPANPRRDTHRPGGGGIEPLLFPVPPAQAVTAGAGPRRGRKDAGRRRTPHSAPILKSPFFFESVLLPRHSEAVRRSNPHLSSSHNTTHFVGLVLCKRRGLRILRFAQNDKEGTLRMTEKGRGARPGGRPKAAPTPAASFL